MNIALISLIALLAAIVVSCTSRVNVGLLALVLAWFVGVNLGGLPAAEVLAGFPAQLFVTLVGVTMLFTGARANGTLDHVAHHAVRLCRGNAGVVPMMFFALAASLASVGPGNIASAAVMAPVAMAVARRTAIPAFLMALMVGNGANSGSLSPFAPTGIIVNGLMARIGLPGYEWYSYVNNLLAHAALAFTAYFVFGGWKLFSRGHVSRQAVAAAANAAGTGLVAEGGASILTPASASMGYAQPFERHHWITLIVIGAWIAAVLLFKANPGIGALGAALLLVLIRAVDESESVRLMPWGVILMVSGVTVLIALLEKTGGMALFSALLARISTPATVTGTIAFVTGLISTYSSTSGVVLPAFLPTVPGLVQNLGGGDPLAVASAMNVGAHLVDVSPLSTIGALCIASVTPAESPRLFNQMLAWGLSMCIVGALWCWVVFGWL